MRMFCSTAYHPSCCPHIDPSMLPLETFLCHHCSARQRIDTLMEKSTQALQMAWQLSGGQHKEDHHTGGKMVAAVLHDASQEAEPFFQQARASV